MSNAPQHHETPGLATSSSGLPPVLTRVPWLARQPAVAAEVPPAEEPRTLDASFFAPHQLLASADSEVVQWGAQGQHLRIDAPQPLNAVAPSAAAPPPPVTPLPLPAVPRPLAPKTTPVTSPSNMGITHLRFDPPVETVAAQSVEQAKSATVQPSAQPSPWHEWVTTVDNTIRQYHRVIMLAALLTAAGLMMLVLEHQTPDPQTAPQGSSPTTIDESVAAAVPLARNTGEPPAEPERIAMAQGPGSHGHRDAITPIEPAPTETLRLEPIESDSASPAKSSLATSPTAQWPITLPEQPQAELQLSDSQTQGYPTTGCVPLEWPHTAANSAGEQPLNRARLSGNIQPPNQQIK